MRAPTAAVSLACPLNRMTAPWANPYPGEFATALALLLGLFILWRRVRPPALRLLRCYAGMGGVVAFLVMQVEVCGGFDRADAEDGYLLVAKISVFIAISLLVELVLSLRPRCALARAVARRKRDR